MLNLATGASPLEVLLREVGGVISAVLGTTDGEVRAATAEAGAIEDLAAVTAAATRELVVAGELLGLGAFASISIKGATTTRVFARQGSATLALEVDSRQPLGELEAKLRGSSWQFREAPAARPIVPPPPPPPRNGSPPRKPNDAAVAAPLAASGSRPISRAIIPPPASRPSQGLRTQQSPLPAPLPSPPASSIPVPEEIITRERPAVITRPRPALGEGSTRAEKSGGVESAFAGELEEFPLADLIVFMRNGVRTGLLTCFADAGTGSIRLARGLITGADSPGAGTLRDHLLARPELTASQRLELTVLPHEAFLDDAAEQALLPRSLVSATELMEAREARIFAAFREMLTWKVGRFSFEPSAPSSQAYAIELTAQSVLLQIFREHDEQSR
jgi:predicted regulator of Ras-like GTPase activity (Roadblock/LC7/MglB family)